MSLVQDAMPSRSAAPAPAPQAAAGLPERGDFLNLARRPFLNSRPVVRTAMLLWLLGALLLMGNVMLFWGYLSGSEEKRTELDSLTSEIETERARRDQLRERVAARDLEEYNREVQYLNRKIQERTFSWSLLFDNLARVLPNDVRITRLKPAGVVDTQADRRLTVAVDEGVTLQIQAEAKNEEAFLRFVDNLYTPPFDYPDFTRDIEEEGGLLAFDLTVRYLPEAAAPESRGAQGVGAAPEVTLQELPADPAAPAAPSTAPVPPASPGGRP
jgi:Tfp pilus assembly protein PilN